MIGVAVCFGSRECSFSLQVLKTIGSWAKEPCYYCTDRGAVNEGRMAEESDLCILKGSFMGLSLNSSLLPVGK